MAQGRTRPPGTLTRALGTALGTALAPMLDDLDGAMDELVAGLDRARNTAQQACEAIAAHPDRPARRLLGTPAVAALLRLARRSRPGWRFGAPEPERPD